MLYEGSLVTITINGHGANHVIKRGVIHPVYYLKGINLVTEFVLKTLGAVRHDFEEGMVVPIDGLDHWILANSLADLEIIIQRINELIKLHKPIPAVDRFFHEHSFGCQSSHARALCNIISRNS